MFIYVLRKIMCMSLTKVIVCVILREVGIQHTPYINASVYKKTLSNDSFDFRNTHIMGWYSSSQFCKKNK